MPFTKRTALVTLCVCWIWASAFADDLPFQHYSIDEGLSLNTVSAIEQDARGFLWVGTQEGLNLFDGYRFDTYRHDEKDPKSLSHSSITALLSDSEGTLWVGTDGGGLCRHDLISGGFECFRSNPSTRESLIDDLVRTLLEYPSGTLWIGTASGLARLHISRPELAFEIVSVTADDFQIAEADIRALAVDAKGNLWLGTLRHGLFRYAIDSGAASHVLLTSKPQENQHENFIRAICVDSTDTVWIGTDRGGLYGLDPETGAATSYRRSDVDHASLPSDRIRTIFEDSRGRLWVGTDGGGLSRFDREAETFESYAYEPHNSRSLGFDSVVSLAEDRSGILWVGTNGAGLSKAAEHQQPFSLFRHAANDSKAASRNVVTSVLEDHKGDLWVGSSGGGMTHVSREGGIQEIVEHDPENPDSPGSNEILGVIEDSKGRLWIATSEQGLDRFDPVTGRWHHYRANPEVETDLADDRVISVAEGLDGSIWVGTVFGGLHQLNPDSGLFTRFSHDPVRPGTISSNFIVSVFIDSRGRVWAGTDRGLNRLHKDGTFTSYTHDLDDEATIGHDYVMGIAEAHDAIWAGTYGGGLNRIDEVTGKVTRFGVAEGLPDNTVYGVLEDSNGKLWLSTNVGLSRMTVNQGDDGQVTGTFRNFDASYGLQSNEFNQGAFFKSPTSGELFFGGIRGLTALFPDRVSTNDYIPPVAITDFKVFNRSVAPGTLDARGDIMLDRHISVAEHIVLSHHESSFSFEFAALDYTAPSRNLYAYRMEGFLEEWISASAGERVASYTHLDPGEYSFHVRASNNDHLWNNQGAVLRITIRPPFWATLWFRTLIVFALAMAVLAAHRLRTEKIHRRAEELATINVRLNNEIEERQRAEIAIRVLNAELEDRVRGRTAQLEASNQELEAFAYSVSHDLRAPLRAIDGFSLAVMEDCAEQLDEVGWGHLARVRKASQRMDSLIDEILDLSRINRIEMCRQEVDLSALAEDIVKDLQGANPERRVETRIEPGLVVVADPTLLRVSMENLIGNAWKFTRDRCDACIEVGRACGDDGETFLVRDNGVGFDMDRADRIFAPFKRLHNSRDFEGSGVGLATVNRAVRRHGGRVWAESSEDHGACFFFTLQGIRS